MRRRTMATFSVMLAIAASAGCTSSCPAWDARGVGWCNLIIGYTWDGHGCVEISGCGCVGADCDLAASGDDDGAACRAAACEPRRDGGTDGR